MDKDGKTRDHPSAANREDGRGCEGKQESDLEKADVKKVSVEEVDAEEANIKTTSEKFSPVETGDGSCTFYSESFGEWFHSRDGAYNEAQKTYVEASNLAKRAEGNSLKILDVCYGLGYNTAAALETIWQVNLSCEVEVQALEIDIEVAKSAIAQGLTQQYSPEVQTVLRAMVTSQKVNSGSFLENSLMAEKSLAANLRLGDARQQIQLLVKAGWQADVVFLDPFSPPHCPQLWTVEFLQLVAQCLDVRRGVLVTYSCAAAVRTALKLAGLTVASSHSGGRHWPGTIAAYNLAYNPTQGSPLSLQEKEHLQTRAAVPYRDPTLRATAKEILALREQEQNASRLLPTAPWRRRWQQQRQLD